MRFKSIVAAAGLLAAFAGFTALPAFAQTQKAVAAGVTPICAECHAQSHNSTMLTAHGANNDANGGSCQTCHGDATLHLKDPTKNKPVNALTAKDATPAQKTAVCMTCHAGQRQLSAWASGVHKKYDVSCVDCHAIHGSQAGANFKNVKAGAFAAAPYVTTQRQLAYKACIACHRDQRGEIVKPSHHPIIEGKVACHDCHDPHGSLSPYQIKAETTYDLCTAATPTSAGRGSTNTHRSWRIAAPAIRHTARRTTACSRRSRRRCARTAIRAGTPTASTTGEGRSPGSIRRISVSREAAASAALARSTAAMRRRRRTANSSFAETRGQT